MPALCRLRRRTRITVPGPKSQASRPTNSFRAAGVASSKSFLTGAHALLSAFRSRLDFSSGATLEEVETDLPVLFEAQFTFTLFSAAPAVILPVRACLEEFGFLLIRADQPFRGADRRAGNLTYCLLTLTEGVSFEPPSLVCWLSPSFMVTRLAAMAEHCVGVKCRRRTLASMM